MKTVSKVSLFHNNDQNHAPHEIPLLNFVTTINTSMCAATNRPKSATHDCSTVHTQQSRRVLVLRYLIFQLFSGTDFKITCQQELFSYLETLLSLCRFLHSPGYSIPFHSQNLVPSSFACFVRDLQAFERKKELSPFSSFTLRTTASMVDTKHMPDYDVTRMKQINKHERSSRVPNFFIAFSITCDL